MRGSKQRVVIVGGGYVGLYAALVLEKRASRLADVTLVNAEGHMTYQPFLPEAAAGNVEPRHVAIPLRRILRRSKVVVGAARAVDRDRKVVTITPPLGRDIQLPYDHLVIAVGSVSRVLPVPGLAERAIGFKSIGEAIFLRNQVLSMIDAADSLTGAERAAALSFVFVGGGYAGIEALGELEDLARDAASLTSSVSRDEMRWVLVEATDGILPEVGPSLGNYALDVLRDRGVEIHLGTRLEDAREGRMQLSDSSEFEAQTIVWTAGVKGHPLSGDLGLPLDDRGRIQVDAAMRATEIGDVWAAGDCAAVPDLVGGGVSPPTAQHALRQGKHLGKNIAAVLSGGPPQPFRYKQLGSLASLGRHRGVAVVLGVRLKGISAWFLHRTYHLVMLPTWGRRIRVALDWTVALLFKRDVVSLGSLAEPRKGFLESLGRTNGR
jgi:NADH:ubiquinone reductase (H+-translocating)